MEKKDARAALAAFAALAQESRLDVFRLLVRVGPEGVAAGTVSEALDIPPATLSFHLKELRSAGLVRRECLGRSRIYRADLTAVGSLIEFLTTHCCAAARSRPRPVSHGPRRPGPRRRR